MLFSLIVIGTQNPIKFVEVVLVHVNEGSFRLQPQIFSPFRDSQVNGWQFRVIGITHEQQLVAPLTPRVLDVLGLRFVIDRICHHPAQHIDFVV